MKFDTWLDTFIDEKGLDREHVFTKQVEGGFWGTHIIPLQCVIDELKASPADVKKHVQRRLLLMDYNDQPVMHFFDFLAQALAEAAES